ncbi:MAG TPA: biotin/lipoyl-binding protein, partial [Steroidobacteraceae bacterium]|nr:biotin/lipoyl-binding protein [Steroidobacteraceae bacterium]
MDKSELLKQLRIDRDSRDEGPPPRWRLWIALGVALLAAAALAAWLFGRAQSVEVTTATARALPAVSGGTSVLDATGYVTARRQATVSAKITGKVREVLIEEGQAVEAGDVLARLDDSEARVDVELRRAQVAAARAQLEEAEATAANARREYGRQQELAALKLTSASAVDAARAAAEASVARVSSQRSAIRVAEEALQA